MGTGIHSLVRSFALAGCVGLIGFFGPVVARAQFAPSLPYNPYNSQNLTFSYPTVVNPSLPNQSRLMFGSPNQFAPYSLDAALLGVDGLGTGSFPRGGRGVPYFSSSRPTDRSSSAAQDADSEFATNQARRDSLYVQIAQERDLKKREALQKELAEVNEALDKDLGKPVRRTGAARSGVSGSGTATAAATARRGSRGLPLDPPRRTGVPLRPKPANRAATPPADEPAAGSGAAPGTTVPAASTPDDDLALPSLGSGSGLDSSLPGLLGPTIPSALDPSRLPRTRSSSLSDLASPNALRQRGSSLSGSSGSSSLGTGRPLVGPRRVAPRTPEVKPPDSAGTAIPDPRTP
jgi:hypothetical protein